MALLNYSTDIPASRSVAEIQQMLGKHGAKAIMVEYSDGVAESISFKIEKGNGVLVFRLPTRPKSVLTVLERQHGKGQLRHGGRPGWEQAVKVAWRIVKDWVEAQMAILETEMVAMEEIFLPYLLANDRQTLYEAMVQKNFYLSYGKMGKADDADN